LSTVSGQACTQEVERLQGKSRIVGNRSLEFQGSFLTALLITQNQGSESKFKFPGQFDSPSLKCLVFLKYSIHLDFGPRTACSTLGYLEPWGE
jgi:hypothetical protein